MAEDTNVRRNADGSTTTTTTRYPGDTATTGTTYAEPVRRGGNPLLWLLLALLLIAGVTYALGLWSLGTSGTLRAPDVKVSTSGGEVPKVAVDTAKIDLGTHTETVKIKTPTLHVEKADKDTAEAKAASK